MNLPVDPLIGSTLAGRYRIQARVGAGAMGAVYRADQVGLSRPVALKVLKQDARWDPPTVARFHREAKAMSALTHPNTVRVFDFGSTDQGMLFLAMEFLHGELASERLEHGPVPPRDAVRWTLELLASIAEAHEKRIIHRDLKPENLFLASVGDDPPSIKVLDFGIAKAIEGEHSIDQFETLDGTVFGTPRYMSPEQAAGKPLDHRSDLYAVGIVLYELLTGAPPFVDPDAVIVMAKHIREAPPPLRKAAPSLIVPASLQRVLDRALLKQPDQRFQSAGEFAQALRACEGDLELLDHNHTEAARLLTKLRRATASRWTATALGAAVVLGALALWLGGGEAAPEVTPATQISPTEALRRASKGLVTLNSRPARAEVWHEGRSLGSTPLDLEVPEGRSVRVELRKVGFSPQRIDVTATPKEKTVELAPLGGSAASKARADRKSRKLSRTSKARAASRKAAAQKRARPPKGSAKQSTERKQGPSKPAIGSKAGSPYEKFL